MAMMVVLVSKGIHCGGVDQVGRGVDDGPKQQPDEHQEDVETQEEQNYEQNQPVRHINPLELANLDVLIVLPEIFVLWKTAADVQEQVGPEVHQQKEGCNRHEDLGEYRELQEVNRDRPNIIHQISPFQVIHTS